ncbi:DUF1534 domain-containing protein [Pseudomonas syringae]|nr:DUF1534 domain-containing protein [Pseudomonas syringae]
MVELPTQSFSTKLRLSFLTLQRGNTVHDALRRQEDAERPERHDDAERRTIVELPTQSFSTKLRLSFPTLQRGNAVRDALRRQEIELSRHPQRTGFFRPMTCENTACKSSEALSSSRLSLLSMWSM